jgi:alkanesulfonate monooxygenase SsuD/methylene tetrahydromethanopterin reductase-like flavin-dependent oxidoreductase (luciferase family)
VLGVIAGCTRRLRLGSAVSVLSTDDPVRLYQRFATLHAASDGRAEIMVGRGAFTESFALFGYDNAEYGRLFEAKLEALARLLHTGASSGQRVMPSVAGGPIRTWVAVGATPESALRAARHGMPMLLAVIGGEAQRFVPFAALYREACARLGRPPPPIGVHSVGHVAETDQAARQAFWPAYQQMRDRIGAERGWPPLTRRSFEAEVDRGALYVGAPDTVAARIAATVRTLGAARFQMRYSVGGLPHDSLVRSITLYGQEVGPRLRALLARPADHAARQEAAPA